MHTVQLTDTVTDSPGKPASSSITTLEKLVTNGSVAMFAPKFVATICVIVSSIPPI